MSDERTWTTRARAERGQTEPPGSPAAEALAWIADGCVLLDGELRGTWMNREAGRLLGLPDDALVGRRPGDVAADGAGHVVAALGAAAAAALASQAFRQVEVHDDASGRWLELRLHPSPEGVLVLIADVTARRDAVDETAARLEELRQLVEQAPAFLWVVDPELRVRRMYGAAELLREIGSDRIVGRTIDEGMQLGGVPPDAQALWRDMHRRALRGGVGEYLAHYAGKAVEARVQPLRDAAGAIVGILGVGIDVTERERAEAERRAHVWFLEGLARVNRAIQGTTDLERMMCDVLDVVLDVLDADQAGLLYPCDPDADAWRITMFRARRGAADSFAERPVVPRTPDAAAMMQALRAADGPLQFGPESRRPLPDVSRARGTRSLLAMAIYPKGDQPYFLGVGQATRGRVWTPQEERLFQEIGRRLADALTSLKSVETARGSEARFRALVEFDDALIGILDERARLVYASPSYVRSLGYTPEELRAMDDVWPLVHPDDLAYAQGQLAEVERRQGVTLGRPVRCITKDGGVRSFAVTLTDRRQDPAVRGVIVNARDLTDELLLEGQLLQAQKLEAVGQLAGGIAHDFNNLLMVIRGNLDFVAEDLPPDHPAHTDLAAIRAATDRTRTLVRQLLAFSRQQVLAVRRVDVNAVVRDAERLLRRVIGEEIALQVAAAPEPLLVEADPGQLEQVLLNLAINARDAMLTPLHGHPGTGGALTVETDAATLDPADAAEWGPLPPGPYVRLTVRDTGHGMDAETAGHVFEPFFTTKPVGEGTGLGLATAYGIVAQSGGTIRVRTAPGAGTTFVILLPRVTGPAAEGERAQRDAAAPVEPHAHGTVLLVEDEGAVRSAVRRLLARRGYAVLEARHGADALLVWREHRDAITAVVTDLRMPELGGRELVALLRAEAPSLPVVYVSGYAEHQGMDALRPNETFLEKPFTGDALLGAVARVVEASRRPR